MKYRKCCLNIRNILFTVTVTKHWNRLLREFVEPPSMEILETQMARLLGNLV